MKKITAITLVILLLITVMLTVNACTGDKNEEPGTTADTVAGTTAEAYGTDVLGSDGEVYTELFSITITASSLNVRSTPDFDGTENIVGYLTEGQTVSVTEEGNGWYGIIFQSDSCKKGKYYIGAKYTKKNGQGITDTEAPETSEPEEITSEVTTSEVTTSVETEYNTDDTSDILIGNEGITFSFSQSDEDELFSIIDNLHGMLDDGSNFTSFSSLYDEFENEKIVALSTQCGIAFLEYSLDYNNTELSDRYVRMIDLYSDIARNVYILYKDVYNSPYRDAFFSNWTQKEINLALRLADTYTDEFLSLTKEYNNLVIEYNNHFQDEDFDVAALYMKMIAVNKHMAEILGYDNYMDYAYELIYKRDYKPADVSVAESYVTQYIVPCLDIIMESFSESATAIDADDYEMLMGILDGDITDTQQGGVLYPYMCEFMNNLGKTAPKEYNNMWKNGNYFIAYNEERSKTGAFTVYLGSFGTPVCYFGPGYQKPYTLIHEFGHYYSFTYIKDGDVSNDLSEVFSQGTEGLFTAGLSSSIGKNTYNFLMLYRLYEDISDMLQSIVVNNFETYIYTHDDYSAEDLDDIYRASCEKLVSYDKLAEFLGYPPEIYWPYVVVENPGYYISYAVSLVPSLQLFFMGEDNMTAAISAYNKLLEAGDYTDYIGTLEASGLYSPLGEEAYKYIGIRLKNLLETK